VNFRTAAYYGTAGRGRHNIKRLLVDKQSIGSQAAVISKQTAIGSFVHIRFWAVSGSLERPLPQPKADITLTAEEGNNSSNGKAYFQQCVR